MKKFEVGVVYWTHIEVEAEDEAEAIRMAEDEATGLSMHDFNLEIDNIVQLRD